MCYPKPGPRCSYHAEAKLNAASKALYEAKEKFADMENSGDVPAEEYDKASAKVDKALRGYTESVELYWETSAGRKNLSKLAQENGVPQAHIDTVVSKLKKGEPITDEDRNPSEGNPRGVKFLNKMVSAHYSYEAKKDAYNKSKNAPAEKLIDRDSRPEYIASIETKHITGNGAGSKFTDSKIKSANDVITLAKQQRGSLDGDDRAKLIEQGADSNSFLPESSGVRYLMVKTNGTQALKDTKDLDENTVLTVTAKGRNDGEPSSLSLSTDVKEQPTTQFGTVIIGPKSDDDGNPVEGTQTLWTLHPGVPTRGIRSDTLREHGLDGGSTITVKELREKFGKDIKVNTRIIK